LRNLQRHNRSAIDSLITAVSHDQQLISLGLQKCEMQRIVRGATLPEKCADNGENGATGAEKKSAGCIISNQIIGANHSHRRFLALIPSKSAIIKRSG